ncbi:MAG TPA: GIY-YIG nuclease family protein [Bradyrhizobium sp.]|jgi:putative endonuclease|nr:GIY-YIG nuclease family protein [Bradyrhizobium sp.]
MSDGAYLYVVECNDGSLYVGTTRSSLEARVAQHNAGTFPGYTQFRRPVELIFSEWFDRITDAIAAERKLKVGVGRKSSRLFAATLSPSRNWRNEDRPIFRSVRPPTPHPEERPFGCVLKDEGSMVGLMVRDGAKRRLLTMRV